MRLGAHVGSDMYRSRGAATKQRPHYFRAFPNHFPGNIRIGGEKPMHVGRAKKEYCATG